ncbi:MAG: hypothetical protein CMH23_05030 [Methylophaga sp.]|nr:hypothetical protein [Methylophaga sp.]
MKATSYQENTHSGKSKCDLLSFRRTKMKKVQKKSQTDWVWLNLHRRREKYKTIEAEHSYGLVIQLTECKPIRHERLLLLKREYVPFQKHTSKTSC